MSALSAPESALPAPHASALACTLFHFAQQNSPHPFLPLPHNSLSPLFPQHLTCIPRRSPQCAPLAPPQSSARAL
eukprot:1452743-Rhodomonas_salina.2